MRANLGVFFAGVSVLVACGQMYDKPGQTQQQPQNTQGPPGANNEGWSQPSSTSPTNPNRPDSPAPPPDDRESPDVEPARPARPMPPAAGLSADASAFVDAHNRVRAKHCAPPLSWSAKLAEAGQRWADSLKAQGCKFDHSRNNAYGENLAMGTIGALDPISTVAMWYEEIKLYKFPSGGFSGDTGHFTQVVWRGTTQVGCGHAQCNGNDLYVCEYNPPGNFEQQYETNVLPAGCK